MKVKLIKNNDEDVDDNNNDDRLDENDAVGYSRTMSVDIEMDVEARSRY